MFAYAHSRVNNLEYFFHYLDIMNNAAMNIYVQIFVRTCVSTSLGSVPRCGTTGSYGNSV